MRPLIVLLVLLVAGCGSSFRQAEALRPSPAGAQTAPTATPEELNLGGEIRGRPGEHLNLLVTILDQEDGILIQGDAIIDNGESLRTYTVQGTFIPGNDGGNPIAMLELYPWDEADTESMTLSGTLRPGGRISLNETGAPAEIYGTVDLEPPVIEREISASTAELGQFRLRFIGLRPNSDPDEIELDVRLTERRPLGLVLQGTWTTSKMDANGSYLGIEDHGEALLSFSEAGVATMYLNGRGLDHRGRSTSLTYAQVYMRLEGPAPAPQVALTRESWFKLKRSDSSIITVFADPNRSLLLPLP